MMKGSRFWHRWRVTVWPPFRLLAMDPHHISMAVDALESDTFKPFIIPILGLVIGGAMMAVPKVATVGKLVLYFGAQSFMNIYMGWVFHIHVIFPQGFVVNGNPLPFPVYGAPVGFALTAMQQV